MRNGKGRMDGIYNALGPVELARVAVESGRQMLEAQARGEAPNLLDASNIGRRASAFSAGEHHRYRELVEQATRARQAAIAAQPAAVWGVTVRDVVATGLRGWRLAGALAEALETMLAALAPLVEQSAALASGDPDLEREAAALGVTPDAAREVFAALAPLLAEVRRSAPAATDELSTLDGAAGARALEVLADALTQVSDLRTVLGGGIEPLPNEWRVLLEVSRKVLSGEAPLSALANAINPPDPA